MKELCENGILPFHEKEYNWLALHENEGQDKEPVKVSTFSFSSQDSD